MAELLLELGATKQSAELYQKAQRIFEAAFVALARAQTSVAADVMRRLRNHAARWLRPGPKMFSGGFEGEYLRLLNTGIQGALAEAGVDEVDWADAIVKLWAEHWRADRHWPLEA